VKTSKRRETEAEKGKKKRVIVDRKKGKLKSQFAKLQPAVEGGNRGKEEESSQSSFSKKGNRFR